MIYAHIESVFLVVIAISQDVLMMILVSLLSHTLVKMLFDNFISSMIEGSKYCRDPMKKKFNKELMMTKKGNEDFENSTKYWICDNDYIDNDVKVRDHCHITGKSRSSDCNINFEQENAMRYNNRDDLLQLSFTLKTSVFSEVYI